MGSGSKVLEPTFPFLCHLMFHSPTSYRGYVRNVSKYQAQFDFRDLPLNVTDFQLASHVSSLGEYIHVNGMKVLSRTIGS